MDVFKVLSSIYDLRLSINTTAKSLSMRCLLYYWQETFSAGISSISSLFRTWILDSSRRHVFLFILFIFESIPRRRKIEWRTLLARLLVSGTMYHVSVSGKVGRTLGLARSRYFESSHVSRHVSRPVRNTSPWPNFTYRAGWSYPWTIDRGFLRPSRKFHTFRSPAKTIVRRSLRERSNCFREHFDDIQIGNRLFSEFIYRQSGPSEISFWYFENTYLQVGIATSRETSCLSTDTGRLVFRVLDLRRL